MAGWMHVLHIILKYNDPETHILLQYNLLNMGTHWVMHYVVLQVTFFSSM